MKYFIYNNRKIFMFQLMIPQFMLNQALERFLKDCTDTFNLMDF